MAFQPRKLSVAVMVALGVVSLAQAQTATTEKTVITGTNIKRIDAEPVAPVEIITREQIERSGLPTIAEVLRNIPSNTGGSFNESFANSFAPGASGIALRGLGQKTTLVLINGRRTSGYGFAQNLQDTFVDLNSIPTAAVERVEILKDGASAIYGSDAIAGVVNVILRQDYKGVELGFDGGTSEGKHDYRFNLTAGMGDLAKDKYNVFGVFDYYKRDLLEFSDTEFGKSRDKRNETGGRNSQSLTGGGTWRQLTPAGALTNNNTSIKECRGTVMTAAQAVEAGLISPIANAAFNLPGNTFCTQDFNNEFTALPKTERFGLLSRGTANFATNMQGYAELGLSRVKTFQTFQDPFFAGTTGLSQTSVGLRPFTYNINFAPGVAGNPYPTLARYQGVLADMGTRDNEITSDTSRLLLGLKYTVAGWDGDSAVGWSKNEVDALNLNRITKSGTSAAFGVSPAVQPPVPTSNTSTYNLDRWSLNSQAVRDSIRINFPRESTSELGFVDTRVTTEFGNLPGGPIGVAAGMEFRKEKLTDRPDPAAQNGEILGQGITATDGDRSNYALFTEFALPITRQLEAQAAVRYDHYSDYGSSTTPKFGLKFKAAPSLLFRANWGKGFRAPTLPEISNSVATFFVLVNDPITNTSPNISGVFAGNPNLKAEKSTSTTLGVVWEPSPSFNFGLDLYEIDWRNIVSSDSFQSLVNANDPAVVIRDPVTGTIITVLNNYKNLASTVTRGADIDARYILSTSVGRFTTRMNVTYIDTFKEDGVEVVGTNGGTNTIPRIKGYLVLDYDNGPVALTGRVNYIHHYWQQLLPSSWFTPQDPRFQNGVYPDHVPRYITYDFYAKYNLTKNFSISGAVINISDKLPPYDPGFSATNLYDFSQYDVRGRQFRLGLQYKM